MSLEDHIVVPFEQSFDGRYGLEYVSPTHARLTVTDKVLGADGTVSSGVYAAMAETIASAGTAVEVLPNGFVAFGLNNSTHVVGAVRAGVLEAVATCRVRGEGEWLWDVEIGPENAPVSAVATVTIAVRAQRV